nr:immunoglobulin heavy chain junction region [Macaca mulatta]MOV35937.1 immunoglobulin heavy chain junction region [Macaca mulatta]MOV35949.1 immunoglobulin heavy chain junction region [Macaca mulatta]MOV36059.1 immunoglobulin heavy chain junction region [Macaca mulatta]MOV36195.1 immunoglobulin heavy chain junction region [Macaca mulatta]
CVRDAWGAGFDYW